PACSPTAPRRGCGHCLPPRPRPIRLAKGARRRHSLRIMAREPLAPGTPGATIIDDEHGLLLRVRHALEHLREGGMRRGTWQPNAYDAELVELRDALAEAKPEDIPPLVEQM